MNRSIRARICLLAAAVVLTLLPTAAHAAHLNSVNLICGSDVAGELSCTGLDVYFDAPTGANATFTSTFNGEPADSTQQVPTMGDTNFYVDLGEPAFVHRPFDLDLGLGGTHQAAIDAPRGLTFDEGSQAGVFTGTSFPGANVRVDFYASNGTWFNREVTAGAQGAFTANMRSGGNGPNDPYGTGNFGGNHGQGELAYLWATTMTDGVTFSYGETLSRTVGWSSFSEDGETTVNVPGGTRGFPMTAFGLTSFSGTIRTTADLGLSTDVEISGIQGDTFTLEMFAATVDEIDLGAGEIRGTAPSSSAPQVYAMTDDGQGWTSASPGAAGNWTVDFASMGLNPTQWAVVEVQAGPAGARGSIGDPRASAGTGSADLNLGATPSLYLWDLGGRDGQMRSFTIEQAGVPDIDGQAELSVGASAFGVSGSAHVRLDDLPFDPAGGFTFTWSQAPAFTVTFPPVETSFDGGVARVETDPGLEVYFNGNSLARWTNGFQTTGAGGVAEFDTGRPDGTSVAMSAWIFDPGPGNVSIDVPIVDAGLQRMVGSAGGPAYPATSPFANPGGLWFTSGGPSDTTAFLHYELPIAALPDDVETVSFPGFAAEVLANGRMTRVPPPGTDLVVAIDGFFPDADDLFVSALGPQGWEVMPPDQVTWCLDFSGTLPPECGRHLGPHAVVNDVPHLTLFRVTIGNPVGALDMARAAGDDRILTAIELSNEAFADGTADAVVVARDRAFPDALASVPLAAAANGPVLLNPIEDLNDDVAAEINRLGATKAYVMGGTAAQSTEVEDALKTLLGSSNVTRLGGLDRFETAEKAAVTAADLWQDAGFADAGERVIVAKGQDADGLEDNDWPDALSGGQLAGIDRQPILLTRTETVPAATNRALSTLGATEVTVLGGPVAVTDTTMAALGDSGTTRNRIGGDDRFHTSTLVADAAIGAGATDRDVIIATGRNYPDGLAAGATASKLGAALVLVDDDDLNASAATVQWLNARKGVTGWVRVAGGPVAVTDGVFNAIKALLS